MTTPDQPTAPAETRASGPDARTALREKVALAIRRATCLTPTYPWHVFRQDAEANILEWCRYAADAALAAAITDPSPGEVERLRALVADYEAVNADKRRLVRELDVALHGEEGAAQQASLCDLVVPAGELRNRATAAEARVKALEEAGTDVAASLAAAISLLERGSRKAAPSNKMFDQMLVDYRNSLERARAALADRSDGRSDR